MSSQLITLAEAVKTLIAGETWSQTFTPTRTAVPRYEAKDGTLDVRVRPVGKRTEKRIGRGRIERIYTVDIVVAKRNETANNTTTDALIDLAEEIADWFENTAASEPRNIATTPYRAWVHSVESMPAAYAWEYAVYDQFVAVRRLEIKCAEVL
jgi:hypothetical protein